MKSCKLASSISIADNGCAIRSIRNRPMPVLRLAQRGTNHRKTNLVAKADATNNNSAATWNHVLVTLVDENPYLASTSRQALDTAAGIALLSKGKITVLFLDDEGKPGPTQRLGMIQEHLADRGVSDVKVLEEQIEHSSGKGSQSVGEACDEIQADLVVLSTEIIHDKHVDANLLAEFVPATILLLP